MYPNPISDLPKLNGNTVHVPNQCHNDEDLMLLMAQPVRGTGEKTRRLKVIRLGIQLVGGFLLAMLLFRGIHSADAMIAEYKEQRIRKAKEQLFQEKLEQRRREVMR